MESLAGTWGYPDALRHRFQNGLGRRKSHGKTGGAPTRGDCVWRWKAFRSHHGKDIWKAGCAGEWKVMNHQERRDEQTFGIFSEATRCVHVAGSLYTGNRRSSLAGSMGISKSQAGGLSFG